MASDRIERLLSELTAEVERSREDERARLGEWFAKVLDHEHNKNTRTVAFAEMLMRGQGDTQGDTQGDRQDGA
jgi:hypothetical protein